MKPPLTVTWQSYDSTTDLPGYNLSDLGGPDDIDKNWPAYVVQYATEWHPHLEAIRQSIIEDEVWAGGEWHQYSPNSLPVLSDGHLMSCTFRAWGSLLTAVWNSELERDFRYIDFYFRVSAKPS
jgi:hypothetical protein